MQGSCPLAMKIADEKYGKWPAPQHLVLPE